MKYAVLLSLLILANACTNGPKGAVGGHIPEQQDVSQTMSYRAFLDKVKADKARLKQTEPAAELLFDAMNHGIAGYWTGTAWDFNGVTRKPREGTIACGYFITHVLSDLGFQIQRVKLAQQASSVMINTLTKDVVRLGSMKALKEYLDMQKKHLVFIIGLDFHTGFILKADDGCYFLHSNYIAREGVLKEKIAGSAALNSSKSFMIGSLSANKSLLAQWIRS